MVTSSIVSVTYGRRILHADDEFVVNAQIAGEGLSKVMVTGAFLVELFHFLQYIPSWMPGGGASRHAQKYSPFVKSLRVKPYLEVKKSVVSIQFL